MADSLKEREAALMEANKELEAFTYSVSHDLKSPILAIEGFSHMLSKHADCLDTEGFRLLEVIRVNTYRLRQIIDDLLALSKAGRHRIRKAALNLTEMIKQVFEELRSIEPERDLQLIVQDLPPALGDPSLIRQVLVNLLGNAVKFTGTRKTSLIVVGGNVEEQENIYFVRDNGVGFNKRYAHKLFEVFQRLHSQEEFKGTGVGLTIVKRIIDRHGGRVWAEGKADEGATFYFALPKNGG
jgi:light-regulated signal transduction histidine kinase (bacteriophytochrome)